MRQQPGRGVQISVELTELHSRVLVHLIDAMSYDMVRRCAREQRPFGVVLIQEGEEAGEVATTATVGCAARIAGWLEQIRTHPRGPTLRHRLRSLPPLAPTGLWAAQFRAIRRPSASGSSTPLGAERVGRQPPDWGRIPPAAPLPPAPTPEG